MVKLAPSRLAHCYTIVQPNAAKDFYEHQNLYPLMQYNFWQYTTSIVLRRPSGHTVHTAFDHQGIVAIKLSDLFTMEVAKFLKRSAISFLWIVAVIYNSTLRG
jgi:hypothetical protein